MAFLWPGNPAVLSVIPPQIFVPKMKLFTHTNINCCALSKHQSCTGIQLPKSLLSDPQLFFQPMCAHPNVCALAMLAYGVSSRGPSTKRWVCLGSSVVSCRVQTWVSRWKGVQRGVNWKNIAKTFRLGDVSLWQKVEIFCLIFCLWGVVGLQTKQKVNNVNPLCRVDLSEVLDLHSFDIEDGAK